MVQRFSEAKPYFQTFQGAPEKGRINLTTAYSTISKNNIYLENLLISHDICGFFFG